MTVAWQPASLGAPGARPRRGRLPWIGWGLVTAWSSLAMFVALYNVLTLDGLSDSGPSYLGVRARVGIQLLLVLVWLLSFNLAIAGLVIGLVCTIRRSSGRVWRSVVLVTVVVLGGVAQVWGLTGGSSPSADDVGLHSLGTCLTALVVAGATAALLGLRRYGDA